MNKMEQKYIRDAENAWQQAWDILQEEKGWSIEAGIKPCKGCVYARKFNKLGKIFRLEAYLDHSPQEVFDVLVPGVCDWPKWNPTILGCELVQSLTENTDIAYSIAAPGAGGLVSSRDFVNLRHWKTKDGITMSSAMAVSHPKVPVTKKHVRGENRPACYAFKPIEGEPNKCHFICILNTDLKGWLPQFLIDQALSGVLMDYLKALKQYLSERHSQRG